MPKRASLHKDAWKSMLTALAATDKLEYMEQSDTVKFNLPGELWG